jgi:CheY-like chemotaxis protein
METLKNKMTKQDLVFIIEDNDMYSMMLEYVLSGSDCYRFAKFKSGEEGLANLNLEPSAVILDYYLPGMDGLRVLKQIKQKLPGVPVVVLSKNMNKRQIRQLLKEGAAEYIFKAKDSVNQLKLALNRIYEKGRNKRKSNWVVASIVLFWLAAALLFFAILYKNIKFM